MEIFTRGNGAKLRDLLSCLCVFVLVRIKCFMGGWERSTYRKYSALNFTWNKRKQGKEEK